MCCLKASPYNKPTYDQRFIACVGANGHYGQDTICDGFCDAVQILVHSLISGDGMADSLVYPILFCVRHSLELYLKDVYNSVQFIYGAKNHRDAFVKLQKLLKIKFWVSQRLEICEDRLNTRYSDLFVPSDQITTRKNSETLKKRLKAIDIQITELSNQCFGQAEPEIYTHDLADLKKRILSIYQIDERIPKVFDPVLPYLAHYEDIDPQGDAFRYLFSRKGKPHLEKNNIGLVNLATVGFQHEEISQILRNTQILLYHLQKEYKTGTFTKDLSREQLDEISKVLPKPKEFANKIKETKEVIKAKYQIGSNKFDEALSLIKRNREFSYNIGKERVFPSLSESTLEIFGECATGARDWEIAAEAINFNELCLLWAFSDISGWRYEEGIHAYYSEDLIDLYRRAKYEHRVTLYDVNPKVEISHVVDGMKKCGQGTYAAMLNAYT